MITNISNEEGPRFANINRRPWAQALQFALEMHPDAESIITNQHTDSSRVGCIIFIVAKGQGLVQGYSDPEER